MITYSRQSINNTDINAVNKVLKSKFLTQGPEQIKFEKNLSKITHSKYVTTFNSATSALHISCMALGVKKGDQVWTCTNSFVASANCALYCQAKVDLVDINLHDFNISTEHLESKLIQAKKKNKLPKVLIPIHFGGMPPDLKKIYSLKKKYKFKIIEDASHAVGARYFGSRVGDNKFSDITVFSFHPVKIITTAEGGAALTNNKKIFEKLSMLCTHGITRDKNKFFNKKKEKWYYEHQLLGYNYRLNDIQSALGISQIKKLNKWTKIRNKIAARYIRAFRHLPIDCQVQKKGIISSYHLFVILIKKNKKKITRDKLYNYLKKKKIFCNVHYIPIHRQPFYKKLGFKEKNFRNAETYYKNCLSIPIYPDLKSYEQKKVINEIIKYFKN